MKEPSGTDSYVAHPRDDAGLGPPPSRAPRFDVTLYAFESWGDLLRQARRVEELGFDGLWIGDHLNIPRRDAVWFEGWTALSALASHTKTVRLGTLVTTPLFRHPAVLWKQVVTVDHVSSGRLDVGLGAGGRTFDFDVMAIEPWDHAERRARFEEMTRIIHGMLTADTDEFRFTGRYYRVAVASLGLRALQRPSPPILLAAHGPAGLRLTAGLADIWNCLGGQPFPFEGNQRPFPEALRRTSQQLRYLDEVCAQIGRDPSTLRRSVLDYNSPSPPLESVDAFEDWYGRYREIGIDHFLIMWRNGRSERVLERVATDVLPAARPRS